MKLFFLGLLVVGFFYVLYCCSMSISSYFELSDLTERAAAQKGKVGAPAIREAIVKSAAEAGVALDQQSVVVTEQGRDYAVTVRWSYPMIVYGDQRLVGIPLWIDRRFPVPPR